MALEAFLSCLVTLFCCCCLVPKSYPALCDTMDCSTQTSLSFTMSWSLLKLMSMELVTPSSHLSFCHPFCSCFQSFPAPGSFPVSLLFTKYKSFSFSISLSNEYSGLVSFRIDWFDLLDVQGTPKSLLQHHISKASILLHSDFFMVQLSHLYMTTGKTIALTR